MATVTSSYETPPSIAWIRDGKLESVHSFGHEGTGYLAERAGTLQAVTWTAPDGIEIEGLLAVPDGPGPHALLVHVHGGPMGAYRDTWAMGYPIVPLLVSRGYAVLHPNPRGSTGRGQAFQDMVVGDMGGADADDLLSGVEALIESGVADPSRIGVFGGSYGGFMATWLPSRSDRFAAAVAISPITDWYSQHWTSNIGFWDRVFLEADPGPGGPYFDRSPVMFADRVNTPTLLTAGTEDRCTPSGQAVEFHQALAERGVPSEVVIYPGEGHGVRKLPAAIDAATRLVGWFEEHMPAR
jgi:dipeptidyl aminopeptidase/acylaminoacyl peptidase